MHYVVGSNPIQGCSFFAENHFMPSDFVLYFRCSHVLKRHVVQLEHTCIYTWTNVVCRIVECLSQFKVIQVACGGHHNLALMNSESLLHVKITFYSVFVYTYILV